MEMSIDAQEWRDSLPELITKAVNEVKPSSRILNDSMKLTKYVKVLPILWKG